MICRRYKRIFVVGDSFVCTLNPQTFEETNRVRLFILSIV